MSINSLEKLKVANAVNSLGLSEADFTAMERIVQEFREKTKELEFDVRHTLHKVGRLTVRAEHTYSRYGQPKRRFRVEVVDKPFKKPAYEVCHISLQFEMEAQELHYAYDIAQEFLFNHDEPVKTKEHFKRLVKDNIGSERNHLESGTARALFWLFDRDLAESDLQPPKNDSLNKVLAVFQEGNDRLYLTLDENRSKESLAYAVYKAVPAEGIYNYIDEGRLFHERVWFDGMVEEDIDLALAEKINRRLREDEDFRLLTREQYEEYRQRFRLEIERDRRDNKANTALVKELDRRLQNLHKGFVFNGIRFSRNFIEYAEQKIGGEDVDLTDLIQTTKFNETTDFNELYERFVVHALLAGKPITVQLGSIKVTISEKQLTNRLGVTSRLTLLNGIRVNNAEAQDLLMRAGCFENIAAYDSLLRKVSKCSLQFHTMLNHGLRFDYWDNIGQCDRFLKFRIVRKGGRNYLVNGDENYVIRDTERLITKSSLNSNKKYRLDFSELFDFFKSFLKLDTDQVIALFQQGLEAFKDAERRSKELLAEAVKRFNVKEMTAIADGHEHHGYLVKGKTKSYFLTTNLKVYEYPSMRYVCIVDKTPEAQVANDKLVNRIYALANDRLLARDIHTLGA